MGIVPPARGAGPSAWKEFRSQKLLRLTPGDDGFVSWAQGKLAFVGRISTVVCDAQQVVADAAAAAGDEDMEPDELLEDLMSDFPFELEDI